MAYPRLRLLARGSGNPLLSAILRLRAGIEVAIAAMLPQPEASLLTAALLGGHGASLGPVQQAFIATGMIHVVAISGLKVALVAGVVYRLMLPLWGLRWAFVPTLATAAAYVTLTGATPAGLRSGIMWTMALLAQRLGRRTVPDDVDAGQEQHQVEAHGHQHLALLTCLGGIRGNAGLGIHGRRKYIGLYKMSSILVI
jgi:predicted membrane metal-binding protein